MNLRGAAKPGESAKALLSKPERVRHGPFPKSARWLGRDLSYQECQQGAGGHKRRERERHATRLSSSRRMMAIKASRSIASISARGAAPCGPQKMITAGFTSPTPPRAGRARLTDRNNAPAT